MVPPPRVAYREAQRPQERSLRALALRIEEVEVFGSIGAVVPMEATAVERVLVRLPKTFVRWGGARRHKGAPMHSAPRRMGTADRPAAGSLAVAVDSFGNHRKRV